MNRETSARLRAAAATAADGLARRIGGGLKERLRTPRGGGSSDNPWIDRVEGNLLGIVAAVQQTSLRTARRLTAITINSVGGAVTIGGISGLISAIGSASTGTAIASLSGAAKVSATLYWIGSTFGLGAVAGGTILGATGLGASVVAAIWAKRWIYGRKRREIELEDHEARVLAACLSILKAIREQKDAGAQVTSSEAAALAQHALLPITAELRTFQTRQSMAEAGVVEGLPFESTLKPVHRLALRRYAARLDEAAKEALS